MPSAKRRKELTPTAHATALVSHITSKVPSVTSLYPPPAFLPIYSHVVALGLGRFSSRITQHQTALLLALANSCTIHVFDPVWQQTDLLVCELLGFKVMGHTYGKITVDERTLFYMPHCGRGLYDNVIWANKMDISRCVLFGNDLDLQHGKCIAVDDRIDGMVGVFNSCAWQWWEDSPLSLKDMEEPVDYNPSDPEICHC